MPTKTYTAGSSEAGRTCLTCQSNMVIGEAVTRCSECGLIYHAECWDENSGCAQYGCKNAPETIKTEEPALQSNVWDDEKSCPECNRRIKAVALKCRYCGTTFDTRDYISSDQYASREYQEKEYSFARTALVILFLFSITGILAPVTLILQLVLRFGGSLGSKLEYKRLPAELRFLNLIGLSISAILVFFGFLALVATGADSP